MPARKKEETAPPSGETLAQRLRRVYANFQLPAEERREPAANGAFLEAFQPAPLPTVDWRTRIPISPPQFQGDCNACSSFALAAAIEALWAIAHPGQAIAVSAGFIHTCLGNNGEMDPAQICANGVDIGRACSLVQANGYALASPNDYPFNPTQCPIAVRAGAISGFAPIVGRDAAQAYLANNGPFVADLYIWQDFFGYNIAQAPAYVPHMEQAPHLHSVCVVGFNPTGWIVKNSFGPEWGDGHGFATIAYNTCGMLGAPVAANYYPRQAFAIQL